MRWKRAANAASAENKIAKSSAPAASRRARDAGGTGKSSVFGRALAVAGAGSIKIPPSAGGGGMISGASTIRGRSTIGSASSSPRNTGITAERGNSMTLHSYSMATGTAFDSGAQGSAKDGAGCSVEIAACRSTTTSSCNATFCRDGDETATVVRDGAGAAGEA